MPRLKFPHRFPSAPPYRIKSTEVNANFDAIADYLDGNLGAENFISLDGSVLVNGSIDLDKLGFSITPTWHDLAGYLPYEKIEDRSIPRAKTTMALRALHFSIGTSLTSGSTRIVGVSVPIGFSNQPVAMYTNSAALHCYVNDIPNAGTIMVGMVNRGSTTITNLNVGGTVVIAKDMWA